jgi:hypothetical protein
VNEQFLAEAYHWIPAPILMAVAVYFFRQWLRGHEDKLSGLVGRLELATNRVTAHDGELSLLRKDVDRHEKEILKLRDRQHELAEELQLLNGRLEGSGPKRWPPKRGDDE